MTTKSISNCRQGRSKIYQLPPQFKRIGLGVAILSFLILLGNSFSLENTVVRAVARYGLLIGLLLISISKEEIEDELVIKLRMQSFALAFIAAVAYTLVLPFVDYLLDLALGKAANFKDLGDFMILWLLLSIQVLYFAYLKRLNQ